MPIRHLRSILPTLVFIFCALSLTPSLQGQGAKQKVPESAIGDRDADHVKERNEWFFRGRLVPGRPAAELRRRAYQAKLKLRAERAVALMAGANGTPASPSTAWQPLGPVPLASDATGNGTQDYHQVAGRTTAVVIDPADASGNTVYAGGAQSGVWKSTNAALTPASNVTWTPLTDGAATLSIGALAIQPGNNDPTKTLILAATGEADNSADSYFGLGILRSADAGNTWNLISTANNGALFFSGLGGTRMAFSAAQSNTVVAAMATTSEGMVAGAVSANTMRGLYTSLDAGQTWTYDALTDPGGATDATSATSVVYNPGAGEFFAALRYHGFYSSPDGVTWTRLANQPGGGVLSTAACPPQSISNNYGCPIYRAEITAVPGRNEMYAWFISLDANNNPVDQFIWQSLNGGSSWTQIVDAGIANCGDFDGCGVSQGTYNLELLAVPSCPDGQPTCGTNPTDLYAGAINLYKCSLLSTNPRSSCSNGFLNLTHVYGCDPIGAPAHVHPDQHALAYMLPTAGSDSGNDLMYFANDGGIYRVLDGYGGLTSGACSGTNYFDDLNQNLGSMTQFVSFTEHPTDPNTLLGGTQDNGSPATNYATTSPAWGNVLGGDGGFNAIDPNTTGNFYASNPDIPPGGLGIQLCPDGVNCVDSNFSFVVTSNTVGGDDGDFYFPYILDPQSAMAMLVGTCRIWRGPRTGGGFTALSPSFETLGSGTCTGSEVNLVRALAAGGPPDANGSQVVYATTSGLGPLNGPQTSPPGGHVWVSTNATQGSSGFSDVTNNGPQGSINPNQFPISSVAIDSSDATGASAYVTVMGFTAPPGSASGTGHVWKTTNFGAAWIDFTGNLPDSPANAIVVDSAHGQVYVGTDVGVFVSPTSAASWTEVGPPPVPGQSGFLPNAAVTALGLFDSGGQELLRASTYGRGIWQFNLQAAGPDYQLAISNSPQTVSAGQNATFNGSATALNGYSSSVTLICAAGATAPPSMCSPSPPSLTPGLNTPFTITASGTAGDYYFDLQGTGSDGSHLTHQTPAVLHILSGSPDFTLTEPSGFPTVNAGSTNASGPVAVTAANGFSGIIALSCSLVSGNGSCAASPASVGSLPATVNVTVNATNLSVGSYQLAVQGTSGSIHHTLVIPFNVGDYQISGPASLTVGVGATGTENLTITASTYYSGKINANCDASALAGASCSLTPANPVIVNQGATATPAANIVVPSTAALGNYNININTQDTTGVPSHSFRFSLTVAQTFVITSSTISQTVSPGQTTTPYHLMVAPEGGSFNNAISLSCSGLPTGAQCVFNPPSPITPGSSAQPVAMTISTTGTTPAGNYSVKVTGTSNSLSQSVIVTLIVTSDFQLAVTQPFSATVDAAGTEATALVTLTPNYTGWATASCSGTGPLTGAGCIVTPLSIPPKPPLGISAGAPSTLTIILTVPASAAPGQYNINLTVADASGQPNHVLQLPLAVQDFSIAATPPSQTVIPGQTSGAYQVTVAPNPSGSSFGGSVSLLCNGLPSGAQCIFNPATTVSPGNGSPTVAMTISTTTAVPTGTYQVTVMGSSGSLSHSETVSLVVASSTTPPDFQLAVTQAFPAKVDAGTSQTAKVSVTPNYTGLVDASCDASEISGQCTITPLNPVAISSGSSRALTLAVAVPNNTAPGQYNISLTVADASGQPRHSVQLPLTIIQDFSVNCAAPCSQTVTGGQTTGAYQITVAPNPPGSSFTGAVALSCTNGLPNGAKCLFNPSTPVTPKASSQAVVLSISTVAANASLLPSLNHHRLLFAWGLLFSGIVMSSGLMQRRKRRSFRLVWLAIVFSWMLFLPSCSGISQGGGGSTGGTPVTYTITVTGTSSGAPADAGQSTQVTLVVN
jgi:uncharacterized membrane protein